MKYADNYRTATGHIKYPFAHLDTFIRIQGITITSAERIAIANLTQFVSSMRILLSRIKSCLDKYSDKSWVEVPFDYLFLDTQSYFLFIQQYLEDLALIIRLSFPKSEYGQLTPKFRQLNEKLVQELPDGEPFKIYLSEELEHLLEIKDIRDDISHRTDFNKSRRAIFPTFGDIIMSGGGKGHFAAGKDLKEYVGLVLERILSYSNVAANFVNTKLKEQHEGSWLLDPPAWIVPEGAIDFTETHKEPLFEPGTRIFHLSKEYYDAIEYFLT